MELRVSLLLQEVERSITTRHRTACVDSALTKTNMGLFRKEKRTRFGYSTGFKCQLQDETTIICAYIGWVETLQKVFRRACQVEMCAEAFVDLLGTFCQLQTFVI